MKNITMIAGALAVFCLMVVTACSDKSYVPGNDPYYSHPQESKEEQKLNEEEQYVDETPSLNEEESGDTNEAYTMPPPSQYDE